MCLARLQIIWGDVPVGGRLLETTKEGSDLSADRMNLAPLYTVAFSTNTVACIPVAFPAPKQATIIYFDIPTEQKTR